jgi:hypothetical protein
MYIVHTRVIRILYYTSCIGIVVVWSITRRRRRRWRQRLSYIVFYVLCKSVEFKYCCPACTTPPVEAVFTSIHYNSNILWYYILGIFIVERSFLMLLLLQTVVKSPPKFLIVYIISTYTYLNSYNGFSRHYYVFTQWRYLYIFSGIYYTFSYKLLLLYNI